MCQFLNNARRPTSCTATSKTINEASVAVSESVNGKLGGTVLPKRAPLIVIFLIASKRTISYG